MNICLHSSAASIDFYRFMHTNGYGGRIFVMKFINRMNISILILLEWAFARLGRFKRTLDQE